MLARMLYGKVSHQFQHGPRYDESHGLDRFNLSPVVSTHFASKEERPPCAMALLRRRNKAGTLASTARRLINLAMYLETLVSRSLDRFQMPQVAPTKQNKRSRNDESLILTKFLLPVASNKDETTTLASLLRLQSDSHFGNGPKR